VIVLRIVDAEANPVALDSFQVHWNGKDITKQYVPSEYEMAKKFGAYAIVDDQMQEVLQGMEIQVVFTGYVADEMVVHQTFLVSADECHVKYIDEKPLTITLETACNDCASCTQEFFISGLWVKDKDENPVALDSFRVMWGDKDITYGNSGDIVNKNGFYALATDHMVLAFEGLETTVTFSGYLHNQLVINESFLFTSDGCHVKYIDNKPNVIYLKSSL
ncbi:hypothetical protein LJC72_13150, partial [Bacteroides sp. OttesenSCG-928-D19]|nr:hypothetical protein [Bacteroides sp. OttesenSCG-928-D19]